MYALAVLGLSRVFNVGTTNLILWNKSNDAAWPPASTACRHAWPNCCRTKKSTSRWQAIP